MRKLRVRMYNHLEKRIWFLATLSKKCEDRHLYLARLMCVVIARVIVKIQDFVDPDPIPKELMDYMIAEIMRIGEYE